MHNNNYIRGTMKQEIPVFSISFKKVSNINTRNKINTKDIKNATNNKALESFAVKTEETEIK